MPQGRITHTSNPPNRGIEGAFAIDTQFLRAAALICIVTSQGQEGVFSKIFG